MEEKNRSVWMRAGVTLNMTEQEYDIIMSGKPEGEELVKEIIKRGDFEFNGDSYIPESEMEQCNEAYGTEYETGDLTFEL